MPRTALPDFAQALAGHLPGAWTVSIHQRPFTSDPYVVDVWDDNEFASLLTHDQVESLARLDGPDARLIVAARPHHRGEFLVGAQWPHGHDADLVVGQRTPHAITVPSDAARAAAAVNHRVLDRYHAAMYRLRLDAAAITVADAQQALEQWDALSDSLVDADGWPLDERYGRRQRERDATAWQSFARYLDSAPERLLDRCAIDLDQLEETAHPRAAELRRRFEAVRTATRNGRQIKAASDATWKTQRQTLPQDEFITWVTERNADAWNDMYQWFTYGPVLADISRLAATEGHLTRAMHARRASTVRRPAEAATPTAGDSPSAANGPYGTTPIRRSR